MNDLDGVLAAKLYIRSRFGADLDNVCDAVAHVALALAVGAHFGGMVLIVSAIAASSISGGLRSFVGRRFCCAKGQELAEPRRTGPITFA
jgi:phosphatidylglycerophosphate synthase